MEGPLISILYFYRVFFICILYFDNQGPWEFLMGQVTSWKRVISIETARSQEHTKSILQLQIPAGPSVALSGHKGLPLWSASNLPNRFGLL